MKIQLNFIFLVLLTIETIRGEPIKWKINLPDDAIQQQQVQSSTPTSLQFTLPKETDKPKSIRLVDWEEWSRMRPSYSATIGAPPLLIVDTDSVLNAQSSSIPEAFEEDPVTESSTTVSLYTTTTAELTTTTISVSLNPLLETTTTSSSTSTTSPVALTTTTTSSSDITTTDEDQPTTTPKPSPDVTLELRNLPDILTILKHLSLIPAVVRSFSNAAISPLASSNTDGFPATASNSLGTILSAASSVNQQPSSELRSRALSANSGYNGQVPKFVTAMPGESEIPQIFVGRRAPVQMYPNMPVPIVPINQRQETMRPVESSTPLDINQFPPQHHLNIYGIDSKLNSKGKNVDSTAYNAPIVETPWHPGQIFHKQRPRFDISALNVNEVEQLGSIHRKLFQRSSIEENPTGEDSSAQPNQSGLPLPLTEQLIFASQKPHQMDSAEFSSHNSLPQQQIMSTAASINSSALKPEMISELMMIKDIPDLEELTKGMDLTLLNKPGGFALLKEQFIERLIQRTLVQKKLLRRKFRRNRKRKY